MMPTQGPPSRARRHSPSYDPPAGTTLFLGGAGLCAVSPATGLVPRSQSPPSPTLSLALATPGRSSSSSSGTWAPPGTAGSPPAAEVLHFAFQRTPATNDGGVFGGRDGHHASSPALAGNATAPQTMHTSGLDLLAAAAESESAAGLQAHGPSTPAAHGLPQGALRCCAGCGSTWSGGNTWRRGPKGPGTLCNKCGIRHARCARKGLQHDDAQSALPAPCTPAATEQSAAKVGRWPTAEQLAPKKRGRSEDQQDEAPAAAPAAATADDSAAGAGPRKSRRVAERSARRQAAAAQEAAEAAAAAAEEAAELEAASALLVVPACTWVQQLLVVAGPDVEMLT